MLPLATALMLVLQVAGLGGDQTHVYRTAGRTVVLPCSSSSSACSSTSWYLKRAGLYTQVELGAGVRRLARASRTSLGPNCSLVVEKVGPEDAGLYNCIQGEQSFTFLSVLTLVQRPDPLRDDQLRLDCSVWRAAELGPCQPGRLRWVNETGAQPQGGGDGGGGDGGGGDGQEVDCSIFLTVTDPSSRFTCQLLDEDDQVMVEEVYTPDTGPDLWTLVYHWARIVGLILLVGVTVATSRHGGQ